LPAGISALAVPARQKLRPIGVAAAGCPALVTSVVRRAMLRGRLSRLSHGNRGGEEIAPISVSRNSVSCLPPSLAPRGLSRMQAAEYIGVGATKFDEMVSDGRMPRPKRIDGRTVWDRIRLDEAFDTLDNEAAKSEWDRL
jgi:predicted DNA-binding transcriptional regulator AlpA